MDELLVQKFSELWPHLNERQRRLVVGAEAKALGRGGVTAAARAAGISRPTVHGTAKSDHVGLDGSVHVMLTHELIARVTSI